MKSPPGWSGASLMDGSRTSISADHVGNPAGKFTVRLLSFYVFLLVSRVLDLSPIWWMHIPLIVFVVLTFATLAGGGVRYALESKISRYFGLFTLWVAICFPFSMWRAVTQPLVIDSIEFYLAFLIIIQVVRTAEDWRTVVGGYAYGVLVAALYGFLFARSVDGRLALVGGTFGDPNGFALSLLIGAPFLWIKAGYANAFRKIFFFGCSAIVFISFAKAGSRGGLLALSAMLLIMLVVSNARQRLLICVFACLGAVTAATLLPSYLWARYFTIFSPASTSAHLDSSSRGQLESDIESSGERRALLEQSIHMSFEHPIFGVGPGVFAFAAWDQRKAQSGSGGPTLVTHNTYTQISSETGLIGFFFFFASIFLCLKYTVTDYRALAKSGSDLVRLPRNLLLAMTALLVGIFFLSTAYSHFIAFFMALAASLHNVVKEANASGASDRTPSATPYRDAFGASPTPKLIALGRARRRVPSYLRPRGLSKSTAVQESANRT